MKARNRPRHVWTPAEDAILIDRFPNERTVDVATALGVRYAQVNARADRLKLRKSKAFLSSTASGRVTDGRVGHATRFTAGHQTWNKGKHYAAGGRSPQTRFKPGSRTGRAAQLHKPVGTERVTDEGYRQLKISDEGPMHRRWRGVHLIVWEEANGPLPAGHAVCFVDRNPGNCNLTNLQLVTRAELMARNTIHARLPPDLRAATHVLGQLRRRLRERQEQIDAAAATTDHPESPE